MSIIRHQSHCGGYHFFAPATVIPSTPSSYVFKSDNQKEKYEFYASRHIPFSSPPLNSFWFHMNGKTPYPFLTHHLVFLKKMSCHPYSFLLTYFCNRFSSIKQHFFTYIVNKYVNTHSWLGVKFSG